MENRIGEDRLPHQFFERGNQDARKTQRSERMIHSYEKIFEKAKCMASRIMRLKREGDPEKCHEIDLLAQDAQYILMEVDEIQKEKILEVLNEGKQTLEEMSRGK
jgi:superfamily II DNA helicase RecQ